MAKTTECWKPVPGWLNYEVSDQGRVRSLGCWRKGGIYGQKRWVPGKVINAQLANGRLAVTLCQPGKPQKTYGVAYLVLWVFIRPPKPEEVARHYHDPNPLDCRVENLRWGSRTDNCLDDIRHKGKYHTSKLTPKEVIEIRQLLNEGHLMQKDIATRYGVSKATITLIKQGKSQKLV